MASPEKKEKRRENMAAYNRKSRANKKEKKAVESKISGTGLVNLSNFCYGNSMIQSLLPFREIIKERPTGQDPIISKMESVSSNQTFLLNKVNY